MRSKLEQAIIRHLKKDDEGAHELFHEFMVSRARQIHEAIRNNEDPLNENWEEDLDAEEYFTEADLEDLEEIEASDDEVLGADEEEAAEELGDELELDIDGDVEGEDEGEADLDAEIEDEFGEEEEDEDAGDSDLEAKVEDLEAALEALTAEFDAMNGEEEAEFGDDFSEEDEFAELGESASDDMLDKVSVENTDGKEIGAGAKISGNSKAALPQRKVTDREGAKPVEIKSDNHKGFDREKAPEAGDLGDHEQKLKSSKDGLKDVPAPKGGE